MRADFPAQTAVEKLAFACEAGACVMDCSEEQDTADDLPSSWTRSDEETCYLYETREVTCALPVALWCLSQPQITSSMRTTLSDWMQEVSSEYGLKRSTFHTAVSLVDRYLCMCRHSVPKEAYQLVGMAALLVAAKFEEVIFPKLTDFISAAGNAFSVSQLQSMERELLQVVQWSVCCPTLYHWTTWLLTQWDDFVSFYGVEYPVFGRRSEASYALFRRVMQLIDVLVLDFAHFAFPRKVLAAVCVLFALQWDQPANASLLSDFERFLSESLRLQDLSCLPQALQYVSLFRGVPLSLSPPKASLRAKVHYFDYLSVQTYVPGACVFVKRKSQNRQVPS